MEKMITYLKERYNNTPMIITENGFGQESYLNRTVEEYLQDRERVEYMSGNLDSLMTVMLKGADVRGYFAWSLLDNFEWGHGYTRRFGLHHVDYTTLKRIPRLSATWFKEFIECYKITSRSCTLNPFYLSANSNVRLEELNPPVEATRHSHKRDPTS